MRLYANLSFCQVSNPNEDNQGWCCAIDLSKDPIANYVVKSALEFIPEGEQRGRLLEVLYCHREELVCEPHNYTHHDFMLCLATLAHTALLWMIFAG